MFRFMSVVAAMVAFNAGDTVASSINERDPRIAAEYGQTLPPIGHVSYCARNPRECSPETSWVRRIHMTPEKWVSLIRVNKTVNSHVESVSDQDLYGQTEYWTMPTDAGDCEDILLLKRQTLRQLGFPVQSLRITVVLDELGAGHAILTVTSYEGDFILDNRRGEILLWQDTGYTFLKRQSARDPRLWVSLVKAGVGATRPIDVGSEVK
jgi:predicted transglutaminase-like cysteine proteinase